MPCQAGPLGLAVWTTARTISPTSPPSPPWSNSTPPAARSAETGRIFAVYYAERLHVEAAVYAGQLIEQGAVGRVVQVIGLGPHRLNAASRPAWFWEPQKYGGILVDIGSHQFEQACSTRAPGRHGAAQQSRQLQLPRTPGFQDFGDATLWPITAHFYCRVDWFTPQGLGGWGDGRTIILGTDGYIELRKYLDVARDDESDHVYLVDHQGEHHFAVRGKTGFPYFGRLIRDCLDRTDKAMPQRHTFLAIELALKAQEQAMRVGRGAGCQPAISAAD